MSRDKRSTAISGDHAAIATTTSDHPADRKSRRVASRRLTIRHVCRPVKSLARNNARKGVEASNNAAKSMPGSSAPAVRLRLTDGSRAHCATTGIVVGGLMNAPSTETAVATDSGKNPAAVWLGRLGGLKGGRARARSLTKLERSNAARKAARARWRKRRGAG